MNESLRRSLKRLGEAAAMDAPLIFVEHELAIAVRRFGIRKIFIRLLKDEHLRRKLARTSR